MQKAVQIYRLNLDLNAYKRSEQYRKHEISSIEELASSYEFIHQVGYIYTLLVTLVCEARAHSSFHGNDELKI